MRPRKKREGFTLIELLMVVTIIGVIAAIAIPGLLRARTSANEASAIASMRAIYSGQATYASSAARGGYATSLLVLGTPCGAAGEGFVSPDIGQAVGGRKSGYTLAIGAGINAVPGPADCNGVASQTGYLATAVPVTVGATGRRSFIGSQAGGIYADATGAAPNAATMVPANAIQ